jgi:hypothetical protein
MTLQVGLIGTDGVVLASDRLVTTFDGLNWHSSLGTKFYTCPGMACCWSGAIEGEHAAKFMRDEFAHDVKASQELLLVRCAELGWKTIHGDSNIQYEGHRNTTVLAAFDDGSLWETDVFRKSVARRKRDHAWAGDFKTTTEHLTRHYAPGGVEIGHLIVLAAHVICMGRRENNGGIDGLEVVVIRNGQPPLFLSPEQEKILEERSNSIHASIAALLLPEFEYRPVGAG